MKYVFDYEETLVRRIEIHADNLGEAIMEMHRRINDEEVVLCAEDFAGAKLSMPVAENTVPHLERYGEDVKDKEGLDLVIDYW